MEQPPDILTLVNKEKHRRKLLAVSRFIATGLILAIVWIGFIQMNYAKEVNIIKSDYGSLGYCYLCGLETYRKCECQYREDLLYNNEDVNYKEIAEETALYNTLPCPIKDLTGIPNWSISFNTTE